MRRGGAWGAISVTVPEENRWAIRLHSPDRGPFAYRLPLGAAEASRRDCDGLVVAPRGVRTAPEFCVSSGLFNMAKVIIMAV